MADLKEFEALLDAKLEPMKNDIGHLKNYQSRLMDVLERMAKGEERMSNLQADVERKREDIKRLHERVDGLDKEIETIDKENQDKFHALEQQSGGKMWDTIKIMASGILGSLLALMSSHIKF